MSNLRMKRLLNKLNVLELKYGNMWFRSELSGLIEPELTHLQMSCYIECVFSHMMINPAPSCQPPSDLVIPETTVSREELLLKEFEESYGNEWFRVDEDEDEWGKIWEVVNNEWAEHKKLGGSHRFRIIAENEFDAIQAEREALTEWQAEKDAEHDARYGMLTSYHNQETENRESATQFVMREPEAQLPVDREGNEARLEGGHLHVAKPKEEMISIMATVNPDAVMTEWFNQEIHELEITALRYLRSISQDGKFWFPDVSSEVISYKMINRLIGENLITFIPSRPNAPFREQLWYEITAIF